MGAWIETTNRATCLNERESPLAWGRGLKQLSINSRSSTKLVAPRVGAWIETSSDGGYFAGEFVAPRVGAWIETKSSLRDLSPFVVAPRVGAWIETLIEVAGCMRYKSPLAWGRGLKQSLNRFET